MKLQREEPTDLSQESSWVVGVNELKHDLLIPLKDSLVACVWSVALLVSTVILKWVHSLFVWLNLDQKIQDGLHGLEIAAFWVGTSLLALAILLSAINASFHILVMTCIRLRKLYYENLLDQQTQKSTFEKASVEMQLHDPHSSASRPAVRQTAATNRPNGHTIDSEKSGSPSALTLLISLFAVVAPILYAAGYVYSRGFVSEIGLDTDLYPRSGDVFVVKGLEALAAIFAELLPWLNTWVAAVIGLTLGLILLMFFVRFALNKLTTREKIERLESKANAWLKEPINGLLLRVLAIGYVALSLPIIPLALMISLAIPFYFQGVKDARQMIEVAIKNGECNTQSKKARNASSCITISSGKDGDPVTKGYLLISSEKSISIYDPTKKQIRSFHAKDGLVIALDYEKVVK